MSDKEKLQRYSKDEIIEALENQSQLYGGTSIKSIIRIIEDNRRQKAFTAGQTARLNAIDCMNKYFEWQKEVIKKYGNGGSVALKDIPFNELKKGAELEKKWKESEEARKKAEKEEDKFFKGAGK